MATVEIGGRTTGTLTVDERDDRHLLWNTWWHNLVIVQRSSLRSWAGKSLREQKVVWTTPITSILITSHA